MYGPRNPLLSTTRYHLYFDLVNANNLKIIRFQAKVIVESQDRSAGFWMCEKKGLLQSLEPNADLLNFQISGNPTRLAHLSLSLSHNLD